MQAVIFFAFFLLADLFGLADFVVFVGKPSVNQYNNLDVLLKNLNE
jgi:hypothetical protein